MVMARSDALSPQTGARGGFSFKGNPPPAPFLSFVEEISAVVHFRNVMRQEVHHSSYPQKPLVYRLLSEDSGSDSL